jgi:hypothetical protein
LAARDADVTLLYLHALSEPALHAQVLDELQRRDPERRYQPAVVDFDGIRNGVARSRASRALRAFTPSELVPWMGVMSMVIPQLPIGEWAGAASAARRAVATTRLFERCLRFFSSTFQDGHFDAVLLPEDVVGPFWPTAIRAAHDCGIPALVFPYTIADRQEAVQSLRNDALFQTASNRIAARLFPAWRAVDTDYDLVRLPSDQVFAHERLGLSPPDPWMMNSGAADRILVDSPAAFEYFRNGGIPADQMSIVGSVSQDRMYILKQRRPEGLRQLRARLNLRDEKPLWLISGCPNQLSATVPHSEFATMEDLARFVGESLAPLADRYHLVVRPHPNYMEFGSLLQRHGITITSAPTASLVPLADMFVAFASATIRWAVACGVPTINYDVFHYGYSDFAAATGVRTVADGGAFRELARSLTPASPVLQALAANARDDSAHWSVMDGRGIERIESEIARARERRMGSSKEQQRHA